MDHRAELFTAQHTIAELRSTVQESGEDETGHWYNCGHPHEKSYSPMPTIVAVVVVYSTKRA